MELREISTVRKIIVGKEMDNGAGAIWNQLHVPSVTLPLSVVLIFSLKPSYFQKPFLQSHCPEIVCVCACVRACVRVCVCVCVCVCCVHQILKRCTFKECVSA